jgi:hypothetical protein
MGANEVTPTTRSAEARRETASRAESLPTADDFPSGPEASEPSPIVTTVEVGAPSASHADSTAEATVWELDPGVRVPAAFVEPEATLPPGPAAANELIAQEFERTINSAQSQTGDGAASVSEETWSKALEQADLQYRALNGDAAFGQQTMKSALEAGTAAGSKGSGGEGSATAP